MLIVKKFGKRSSSSINGLVILDADGVLWPDGTNLLTARYFLLPYETRLTLNQLKNLGYKVVVATNQTLYARGDLSLIPFMLRIFRNSKVLLRSGLIDEVYVCIHHPNSRRVIARKQCTCRKPSGGMIEKIKKNFSYTDTPIYLVGDRISDAEAAQQTCGISTFLILNSRILESNIPPLTYNDQLSVNFKLLLSLGQIIPIIEGGNQKRGEGEYVVLLLAAGRGKRLSPLTDSIPKVTLSLGPYSILTRLVKQVRDLDPTTNIYINISYLAIEVLFDLSASLGTEDLTKVTFLFEKQALGTSQTLLQLYMKTQRRIVVFHGDLVLEDKCLVNIFSNLKSCNYSLIVCHQRSRSHARSMITSSGKKVKSFEEIKGRAESSSTEIVHVNSGIYSFTGKDLKSLNSQIITGDIPESILPELVQHGVLNLIEWQGTRFAIDTLSTLSQAREFIKKSVS